MALMSAFSRFNYKVGTFLKLFNLEYLYLLYSSTLFSKFLKNGFNYFVPKKMCRHMITRSTKMLSMLNSIKIIFTLFFYKKRFAELVTQFIFLNWKDFKELISGDVILKI